MFKILLVEDDLDIQKLIVRELENEFAVITATTAIEAIHLTYAQTPDVIILDINLNEQHTGIDVAKIINDLKSCNVSIIFMSSDESLLNKIDLRDIHHVAKLKKPEAYKLLKQIIYTHIDKSKIYVDIEKVLDKETESMIEYLR